MIDLLHQVTEAVDGRMELMLDGNSRLSESDAHTIASALDDLNWAWFEEPMPLNPLTYARLNDSVDIPITGGESFSLAKQFEPYLEAGAFTIAQPDVGVCGVSEWLRIVSHAYRCGVEVCPHSWHNGLLCVSHAHLLAALPRPRPLELCMVQGPLQWEILHEPPPIEDSTTTKPIEPPKASSKTTTRRDVSPSGTGVRSTPGARKLAGKLGVDISKVTPTGPGGRVVEEDVRRFEAQEDPGSSTCLLYTSDAADE